MNESRPFPYVQLWMIILLSVVVNVMLFMIWHTIEFRTIKRAHAQQNDALRAEIATLEGFAIIATGTKKDL